MLEKVKIEEAVGMVLCHDITEIRRGYSKGPAFKKGHRVQEADICHLQRVGKRHIYVLKIEEGYVHENDAATAMAEAFCGPGITWQGEPVEGKIKLSATHDGLLYVNVEALTGLNMLGEVMCASRHTHSPVKKGDVVAATRGTEVFALIVGNVTIPDVLLARGHSGSTISKPLFS